ncbi:hypothetical protein EDC30_102111 [Paucimonas lemoignei]|uniref:Uncharacterized protein n=1 Tax=Paucimonas lemoignei TaxID=29443 RepID=A0A4R3HZP5_PAULE|nr:hypothetical protein [Paucimonas lemoignei]TCS38374.1 hypothetical protein EDC30_102111 [Paucimonas lemoignei]
MNIDFEVEWDGPGDYVLVPAAVRNGATWDGKPIQIAYTERFAAIQHELEELKAFFTAAGIVTDPIWEQGGVIYKIDDYL